MPQDVASGILDRTLRNLRSAWRGVAGSPLGPLAGTVRPGLPAEDLRRVRARMLECLEGRGGEVSARVRAADLGRVYVDLDDIGRRRFLLCLANDFAPERSGIDAALSALAQARGVADRADAERHLRQALSPPRLQLLTQFNAIPQGVKFLADLRADILRLMDGTPELAGLEADLKELLASWFDVGFLDLQRITWESSAALLEKLIQYEAVHHIRSWEDLKNRLDSDRRCFAFFHPRMPDEPLIFVEVALMDAMAGSIQSVLDENAPAVDPERAQAAVFYSISNAQHGLGGISFGGFLIKRVVDSLSREFERLRAFATLSPIPGFTAWLAAEAEARPETLTLPGERRALCEAAGLKEPVAALRALLSQPAWHTDAPKAAALRAPLVRLCARYLVQERRGRRAHDRVAHFHLSNGARIERINWLGDVSDKGIATSAGLMVNYRYHLAEIERHHEAYSGGGKIAASSDVRALLKR